MGVVDTVTKDYMRDDRRFADAFNYRIFGGKQVLRAETLQERDTTELLNFYGIDEKIISKQDFRDVLKKSILMYDNVAYYLLLGIENQASLHYAMPVKNMIYDALNYGAQASEASKRHREKKDVRDAEFLSGFSKTDKLTPVITLIILWNSGVWDAPRSLHEMMSIQDKWILSYVPDYRLNLIIPEEIGDFEHFQTELGDVLAVLSAKDDGKKLEKLINDNSRIYSNMDMDSAKVLHVCANMNISNETSEGGINVCKGLIEIKEREWNIGRETGKQEMAVNLYKANPSISLDVIANAAQTTIDTVQGWILSAGLQLR